MHPRTFAVLGLIATLASCGGDSRSADSVLAAQRADSIRALGAAAWSDGEIVAYIKAVSATLVADAPLVERRARSRAVRAFGRTVAASHRGLVSLADSVQARRSATPVPSVSSGMLHAHEEEMRRLARGGAFDLAYVKSVGALLDEASTQLAKADTSRFTAAIGRLLTGAQRSLGAQRSVANELDRNLSAAQARATSAPGRP